MISITLYITCAWALYGEYYEAIGTVELLCLTQMSATVHIGISIRHLQPILPTSMILLIPSLSAV
jgi:hypothetical protein